MASFIFFTRLPFWRLHEPPKESYRTVVEHWPLTGWLTGGIMAAVIYFARHTWAINRCNCPYVLSVVPGLLL